MGKEASHSRANSIVYVKIARGIHGVAAYSIGRVQRAGILAITIRYGVKSVISNGSSVKAHMFPVPELAPSSNRCELNTLVIFCDSSQVAKLS